MTPLLQQQISQFVQQHQLETSVIYRLLDLTSEIGEVAKEILKKTNYGQTALDITQLPPSWGEELGDVQFALICLANSTHIDLEQSVQQVLQKYQQRLDQKQDAGSR